MHIFPKDECGESVDILILMFEPVENEKKGDILWA